MQHGYKTQHSIVTALYTLNNTVAKGSNQMAPPVRTITVALDMSKAFDTINIHTLFRKLLQTKIPGTIIEFIANYIKGRKMPTQHIEITHPHNANSKLAFHKVASFHQRFNFYTADIPPQNNLTLNPDKTTCTLFAPDPAEYKSNLDLKINNTALPLAMHPKVLGLTLNPKLTYSTHTRLALI